MGSIGNVSNTYNSKVDNLITPKGNTIFPDSKISPISYEPDKLMKVNFGNWENNDNFKGIQTINIADIYTTQPYVQANKLKSFKGNIDTTNVPVLKIGNKYYVSDGNHRVVASMLKGKKSIKVKVYEQK